MSYRPFLLICAVLLISTGSFSSETKFKDFTTNLVLPVNVTGVEKIHLLFVSPDRFKNHQSPEEFYKALSVKKSALIEYIPKEENITHWSKIITVDAYIDLGMDSETMLRRHIENIQNNTLKHQVIAKKIETNPEYKKVSFAIQYQLNPNSSEVLFMHYFSGPYDCVGVQMTQKYDHWLSASDTEKEAKKIESFLSKYMQLNSTYQFNKSSRNKDS
tara:strand:- start:3437 stop:4084 length:648 start_codon:yes stop_codon:yes gene_type:complete